MSIMAGLREVAEGKHPGYAALVGCGHTWCNTLIGVGVGNLLAPYLTISQLGGALFGAVFTAGAWGAWAVDWLTGATNFLGDSEEAKVARFALYILVGIAAAIGAVALAGFSFAAADIIILTGSLIILDALAVHGLRTVDEFEFT